MAQTPVHREKKPSQRFFKGHVGLKVQMKELDGPQFEPANADFVCVCVFQTERHYIMQVVCEATQCPDTRVSSSSRHFLSTIVYKSICILDFKIQIPL